jgi:uncharacterized Ntn-hydrolase superfamily protein
VTEARDDRVIGGPSTYSIVGVDPEAGEAGVAVQSKFLSVGAFVPWARGGTGAVATQAMADITFGPQGLDYLDEGRSPEEVVEVLLAGDDMAAHRQVGVVAADGRSASYTGPECFEFANSVTGPGFAAQGNILTSLEVAPTMAETFSSHGGPLASRLLTSLAAGQEAGGEKRGMESAAMLVVKPDGGYGGNHDRWLDLRVDHHDDPITELAKLYDLHNLYFGKTERGDLLDFDLGLQQEVEGILRSIGWWEPHDDLERALFAWLGWHNLEERGLGMKHLDPLVLDELRKAKEENG